MLFGFFSIVATIPITTYKINDQEITYQEWWVSGYGVTSTIMGLLFFITGIGIFKKKKWARIAFLFSLFIAIFLLPVRPPVDYIFAMVVWISICGCYLFLRKSVKKYFTLGRNSGENKLEV